MTDSYMKRDKLVTTLVWHVDERGLYGVFTLPDKETDTKTNKNGLYRIYHNCVRVGLCVGVGVGQCGCTIKSSFNIPTGCGFQSSSSSS